MVDYELNELNEYLNINGMKCKRCGAENPDAKKVCTECGAFLEGYTLNNVTGDYGYRGADGLFYKSEEDYRARCSTAADHPSEQTMEKWRKVLEQRIRGVMQSTTEEKLHPIITQMTQLVAAAFEAGFDAGLSCSKFVNHAKEADQ